MLALFSLILILAWAIFCVCSERSGGIEMLLKSIFFTAILAYSRSTTSFYAYYVLRTLTSMVGEGSIFCLALAYVVNDLHNSNPWACIIYISSELCMSAAAFSMVATGRQHVGGQTSFGFRDSIWGSFCCVCLRNLGRPVPVHCLHLSGSYSCTVWMISLFLLPEWVGFSCCYCF